LNVPQKEVELGHLTPTSVLSSSASVSVDFAPDGKSVAAAMLDDLPCPPKNRDPECNSEDNPFVGLLTVWDTTTGNPLRTRRQPERDVPAAPFANALLNKIASFSGHNSGRAQEDDITLLVLDFQKDAS
jgi:hypothetical protein